LHLCTKIAHMPHLTAQQATEQYKVSIRTLRSLISSLTAEQKQMHLLIKGKQHLISTELLNQHYQARPGASVQNKGAKMQTHNTSPTDAPPTDTANDAKQVQNDVKQVQNEAAKVQNELIAHLTNEVAHLQNANVQLNERLKENNYIIANLTKQIAPPPPPPTDTPGPKPNTTTGEPFIWFVVGLIFGLVVIGLVVVYSG
jgi:tetrahydromethanopterin S-methyltransferase subunit B